MFGGKWSLIFENWNWTGSLTESDRVNPREKNNRERKIIGRGTLCGKGMDHHSLAAQPTEWVFWMWE